MDLMGSVGFSLCEMEISAESELSVYDFSMKTTLAADKTIDGSLATIIDTENPTDLTKNSLMSMPLLTDTLSDTRKRVIKMSTGWLAQGTRHIISINSGKKILRKKFYLEYSTGQL